LSISCGKEVAEIFILNEPVFFAKTLYRQGFQKNFAESLTDKALQKALSFFNFLPLFIFSFTTLTQ